MVDISDEDRAILYGDTIEEEYVTLLIIDHDTLPSPLRFCNHDENMAHQGFIYVSFPFLLQWPDDVKSSPPSAKLIIDNVDLSITRKVRQLPVDPPPTLQIRMVKHSKPHVIVQSVPALPINDVGWDTFRVEGDLGLDFLTREPYPRYRFTPNAWPGVQQT